MTRLFAFFFQWGGIWVPLVLLITLGLSTFVPETTIEVSNESLMRRSPALTAEYEKVRREFGSDEIVAVYARHPQLFSPGKLEQLAALHREFSRLPQAQRVESLFSISNIARTPDGIETGPLLNPNYIPPDPELLERKRQLALENPLLREKLVSADGQATLFSIYLKSYEEGPSESHARHYREIVQNIEAILDQYGPGFQELYQVGAPAVQETMGDFILEDQRLLLPVAAGILILLIGLLLRSFLAALVPVLNTLIATIWVLAAMVLLGIPVNILNSILPALLLIIGATEDVHFMAEFKREVRSGLSNREAVQKVGEKIGLTLLLTGITTTLGFASTAIANLEILRQFGITAGLAMFARLGLTIAFLPALIRLLPSRKAKIIPGAEPHPSTSPHGGAAQGYVRFVMGGVLMRPKLVIFLLAAIALGFAYFAQRVQVGNDLIEFLDPETELVQQIEQTGAELAGTKVFFLTLYSQPGTFRGPEGLQLIARIQNALDRSGRIDSTTSLANFVSLMHEEFSGLEAGELTIPQTENLIPQYLLLLDPSNLRPYVSADYSTANIVVRTNIHDSREFSSLYQLIAYRVGSGQFGNVEFTLTGQSILIAEAVDEIVRGQVLSLAVIIVILFIIVASLFLSWKASLLAVLSNLFPIAILFGIMGLLQIPLNAGTCMVAAITVGIAVDDTLHLMVRYNRELKNLRNENRALEASLLAEFQPVVATSLALAAGFSVLLFSHFIPLRQFAGLSAFVIFLAVVSDLLLTPVLLSTTRLITLWDLLGLRLRRALLERSSFFEGMRPWQAKKIILSANLESFEPGEFLVRQGELGDTMYVVIDGEVEVRRGQDPQKTLIATLSAGDLFGEIALVSRSRRTADVVAVSPTRVLALDWDSLLSLHRFAPYLSSRIFLNLSRILGERLISSLGKLDTAAPFFLDLERKATRPPHSDSS